MKKVVINIFKGIGFVLTLLIVALVIIMSDTGDKQHTDELVG